LSYFQENPPKNHPNNMDKVTKMGIAKNKSPIPILAVLPSRKIYPVHADRARGKLLQPGGRNVVATPVRVWRKWKLLNPLSPDKGGIISESICRPLRGLIRVLTLSTG
jgi:hypothetical protein